MSKLKVLFVTSRLMDYRVPLLSMLGKRYDLTVAHNDRIISTNSFNQISLNEFRVYKNIRAISLKQNLKDYDFIVLPFELQIINLISYLRFKSKHRKIGFFGLGVRASYKNKYDKFSPLQTALRIIYLKLFDFAIFYDLYPKIKFSAMGISSEKLTVAYNTIVNPFKVPPHEKKPNNYIFIGSLYQEKGINLLLKAFSMCCNENYFDGRLVIIGKGPDETLIKSLTQQFDIEDRVDLMGNISNYEKLAEIFKEARVCISPLQSGLSVQTSFSFSTPFITSDDAITGGERFPIVSGINGDFFNGSVTNLKEVMMKYQDDKYCFSLGKNAYDFHCTYRTPDLWIKAFSDQFAQI